MPQLDVNTYLPQVVWLVITFTALFLVMWRLAVPRIADVLEARQKRIADKAKRQVKREKTAKAEAPVEAVDKEELGKKLDKLISDDSIEI